MVFVDTCDKLILLEFNNFLVLILFKRTTRVNLVKL